MAAIPRIIPPLSTFDVRVGDLRLDDVVLTGLAQQATLSALSQIFFDVDKSIDKSFQSISSVSSYADSISANVNTISLDFIEMSASLSDYAKLTSLDNYTKLSVFNLSVDALDSMLVSLHNLVDELSSKAIFCYLNNVSFLKAIADAPANLSIVFYDAPEMSSQLSVHGKAVVFDSAVTSCSSFIEGLLVNNEPNGVEAADTRYDDAGTQWRLPEGSTGKFGFSQEYNNAPVVLHLVDWAIHSSQLSNWALGFSKSTILYIKYIWYYNDDNGIHMSDSYSQVLPSQSEQTAQRPQQEAQSSNLLNVAAWDSNIDNFSQEAYLVLPSKVNVLLDGLDDDEHCRVYLEQYSQAKEYRVKFTANSSFSIGSPGAGKVTVYGNGVVLDDFADYGMQFNAGKTYYVSIQAGMIILLASK